MSWVVGDALTVESVSGASLCLSLPGAFLLAQEDYEAAKQAFEPQAV